MSGFLGVNLEGQGRSMASIERLLVTASTHCQIQVQSVSRQTFYLFVSNNRFVAVR